MGLLETLERLVTNGTVDECGVESPRRQK